MMSGIPRPASNSRRTVWPGAFRGDQDDVYALRSLDVAEADVEAVGEGQCLAGGQLVLDGVVVDRALVLVRCQDHDDVGPFGGVGNVLDREACFLGLGDRLRALLEGDGNLDAGIAQVQCVGVALGAVADNGNLATLDDRQVGVVVVEHFSHWGVSFEWILCRWLSVVRYCLDVAMRERLCLRRCAKPCHSWSGSPSNGQGAGLHNFADAEGLQH